jgi:hypothetical protein
MRLVGHVTHKQHMKNVQKIVVRKSVVERPLGQPMHGWEDISSRSEGMQLAQDEGPHHSNEVRISKQAVNLLTK